MKKLTFLSLFLSVSALAAGPEVATRDDGNQIISTIKDIEVTKLLNETSQFKKCRDKYQYVENDPNKEANLQAAVACFKQELGSGADSAKKLEELSNDLNLQTYGLVKSNNSKEIQKYLTNKMIQSLTGVNPEEKEHQKIIENLKFGNRKQVDQSVFIKLYKTQLGKNALFEISRFCFENLRLESTTTPPTTPGNNNFLTHWNADLSPLADPTDVSKVNDLGEPRFGSNLSASGDKKQIYEEIFKSIQGNGQVPATTQQFLSGFFLKCGGFIVPLCKKFKEGVNLNAPETSQTKLGSETDTTPTKGAAACLAQSRIQEYKQAMANADKVAEYFDKEMSGSSTDLSAFMKGLNGEPIKRFGDGSDASEATIDDLTNNSSMAFLEGKVDEQAKRKAEECNQNPELSKCEGFIYQDDTLDKVKHKVELEMTLKREVEMARVKKMKEDNDKNLEQYLTDNGYFELLNAGDGHYTKLNADQIAEIIGESYEAKKRATLAEINQRLGFRQIKDNSQLDKPKAEKLTQDSQDERARLSQVVLFNNIITSHLTLKKKDSAGNLTDAGRNVGAWRKEEQALSGQIDENLFANLKASDDETGVGRDAQITDFSLLDEILGKPSNTSQ